MRIMKYALCISIVLSLQASDGVSSVQPSTSQFSPNTTPAVTVVHNLPEARIEVSQVVLPVTIELEEVSLEEMLGVASVSAAPTITCLKDALVQLQAVRSHIYKTCIECTDPQWARSTCKSVMTRVDAKLDSVKTYLEYSIHASDASVRGETISSRLAGRVQTLAGATAALQDVLDVCAVLQEGVREQLPYRNLDSLITNLPTIVSVLQSITSYFSTPSQTDSASSGQSLQPTQIITDAQILLEALQKISAGHMTTSQALSSKQLLSAGVTICSALVQGVIGLATVGLAIAIIATGNAQ